MNNKFLITPDGIQTHNQAVSILLAAAKQLLANNKKKQGGILSALQSEEQLNDIAIIEKAISIIDNKQ